MRVARWPVTVVRARMSFRLSSLRRFSADPLLQTVPTIQEDQRDHPVVALIRSRREQGSLPGERDDGRRSPW